MNRKLAQILKRASFLYSSARDILGANADKNDLRDLAYRLWDVPNTKIASLVNQASESDFEDDEDEMEDDEACGKMSYDDEDEDYYALDNEDEDSEDDEDSDEDSGDDEGVYASLLTELNDMDDDLINALLNEDDDEVTASDYEDEEDCEDEDGDDECDDEDSEEEESEDDEYEDEETDEDSEEDSEDEEDSEMESSKCATDEEIFGKFSSEDSDSLSFMDHEQVDPYAEGESDGELEEMLASGCGSRNKKASQEEDDLFFDEKQLERELTSSISKKASKEEVSENRFQFENSYEGEGFYSAEKDSMIDDFLNGNLENKMELRSAINKSASARKEYIAESAISMDPIEDPMAPVAAPERPRVKKASQGAKSLGSVFSASSEEEELKMLEKLWPKKPDISRLIND